MLAWVEMPRGERIASVDGRNRRRACEMVSVEPATVMLNGEDPVAYVWSMNGPRRDMSKGAKAMCYAKLFPEATNKGGRGKKTIVSGNSFDAAALSKARTVLNPSSGEYH